MLKILGRGNQFGLDLPSANLTGVVEKDIQLSEIKALKAGRFLAIDQTTKQATLADGDETLGKIPLGFIVNDAVGLFFENTPALASMQVPFTFGNCIVISDQIASGVTILASQLLYCGTGAQAGMITNVPPSNSREIGISMGTPDPVTKELLIAVLG
ncbi:hypothetical protein CCP3SC15_4570002 [Gammaproteobacteria bacterium]